MKTLWAELNLWCFLIYFYKDLQRSLSWKNGIRRENKVHGYHSGKEVRDHWFREIAEEWNKVIQASKNQSYTGAFRLMEGKRWWRGNIYFYVLTYSRSATLDKLHQAKRWSKWFSSFRWNTCEDRRQSFIYLTWWSHVRRKQIQFTLKFLSQNFAARFVSRTKPSFEIVICKVNKITCNINFL